MICRNKNVIDGLLDEMEKYRLKDDFLYKERIYIDYHRDLNLPIKIAIQHEGSRYTYRPIEFTPRCVRLREFEITIFVVVYNNKSYIINACKIENIYDRLDKMEIDF